MAIWSEAAEDQLVSMIQERPALYDITEKLYGNRVAKTLLWREIENKLVISEKELKKRWDSLRTQYARYKKMDPSGSCGSQKTGRQQWILSRLQFLEPYTKRKDSFNSLIKREQSGDSDSPSEGIGSDTGTSTSIPEEEPISFEVELKPCIPLIQSSICETESTPAPYQEEPMQSSEPIQSSTPRPRVKRSRRMLEESDTEESTDLMHTICNILESLASQKYPEDDIAAYCKNIECRMRKIPPHLLPHFQLEVDKCLFKYSVKQSQSQ